MLKPPSAVATFGATSSIITFTTISGAASYNIYWGATQGVTTASTKIAGVTSPYSHTGRTAGTRYYYVVTSVDSLSVESPISNEVSTIPGTVELTDNSSFNPIGIGILYQPVRETIR